VCTHLGDAVRPYHTSVLCLASRRVFNTPGIVPRGHFCLLGGEYWLLISPLVALLLSLILLDRRFYPRGGGMGRGGVRENARSLCFPRVI